MVTEIVRDIAAEEAAKLDYNNLKEEGNQQSEDLDMNVEMTMDETDHSTNPLSENQNDNTSLQSGLERKNRGKTQKDSKKAYLSPIIHHKIDLIEVRLSVYWQVDDLLSFIRLNRSLLSCSFRSFSSCSASIADRLSSHQKRR